ncbi:unnamed protein product, partial [Allacma fusca]
MADTI